MTTLLLIISILSITFALGSAQKSIEEQSGDLLLNKMVPLFVQATYPNKPVGVYFDALFLISYILKHQEHGFSVTKTGSENELGDFIGCFAVGLKEGMSVDQVVGDSCAKDHVMGFEPKITQLLHKELNAVAKKFEITADFVAPNIDKVGLIKTFTQQLRQSFYKQSRFVEESAKFKSSTTSKEDTMYLVRFLSIVLDKVKMVVEEKATVKEVSKFICDEILTFQSVGAVYDAGHANGLSLYKLLLEKQKALSSANLIAPLHAAAAVVGYLVLSS